MDSSGESYVGATYNLGGLSIKRRFATPALPGAAVRIAGHQQRIGSIVLAHARLHGCSAQGGLFHMETLTASERLRLDNEGYLALGGIVPVK